ncbi:MAG: 8-amino-7-oxononanoate synthase [Snowella sp.]|nr:8-amino-7-oxononanoate synthase [Snowella sp.]
MTDAYDWIDNALATIHQAKWYRSVKAITSPPGPIIELDGQSLINFASNDYLGLASHPRLKQAAIQAIEQWGTGSTGSRLLSGHRPLHQELETAIAEFKQAEAALVFSSGYLANLGTITALVGQRDLILSDRYNHASLKNGSKLSGARLMEYDHGNPQDLQQKLHENRDRYRRCLIVTDSIFSMDGDACPLPDLVNLAQTYHCMLLIDEAHATGVMGKTGAGLAEHFDCPRTNIIQIGTLSKALGSLGGYVAGSSKLIDFLRNRASTWIYTTGLSPADTAAALEAIRLIQQEPERRQQLWNNIRFLKENLTQWQFFPSDSPILCLKLNNPKNALEFAEKLRNNGFFVPAIRPPTVPTSRLRFSIMATHDLNHIQKLITALQ